LNYPIRLNNQFVALGGVVGSADTAPTQAAYDVYDMLNKQLVAQMAKWRQIVQTDLPAYNDIVQKQQIPAVIIPADASSTGGGNL
jgi:hypothetical protein